MGSKKDSQQFMPLKHLTLIASGNPLRLTYISSSAYRKMISDNPGYPLLKELFPAEIIDQLQDFFQSERDFNFQSYTNIRITGSIQFPVLLDASGTELSGSKYVIISLEYQNDQAFQDDNFFLRTLSKAAIDFHSAASEKELYQRLIETINTLVPDSYIFAASTDDHDNLKIDVFNEKISGILPVANEVLGFDPLNFVLPLMAMDESIHWMFKTKKLTQIPSFIEISGGAVDGAASAILESALGIKALFGIGIIQDQSYFGALVILTTRASIGIDPEVIETLVKQASYAMHRIRVDMALKSAEQRYQQVLNQRILTLTQPEGDFSELSFADLFDIEEIQRIQDAFSDATGVASIITDSDGNPITRPSNFCYLCEHIIRKTEIGRKNCYYSDSVIGSHHTDGPVVQPCHSASLWDAGASITAGEKHIASWLIGQVLDEDADSARLMDYARIIGADQEEYLKALRNVKRMSKNQFSRIAESLFLIANQLSMKALQNIQQARELAERQKIEDENAEIQRRLETLLGNLPGMAYRCRNDRNWTMEFVSKGVVELTGYTPEDLIGNRKIAYNDIIVKDSQQNLWIKWQETLAKSQVLTEEYQIETASGKIKWVWEQGCGIYNNVGEVIAIEGLIIDITSRREAEHRLKESELRFRTLFEDSDDANLIIEEGVFIDCNDAALRLLKAKREEIILQQPFQLSPRLQPDNQLSEKKAVKMINIALKNGSHRFDWMHRRPDGTVFWVEVVLTLIRIGSKELIYTTWRDITERKTADEKLRHMNARLAKLNEEYLLLNEEFAGKNEELKAAIIKAEESDRLKTAFLANMSHEIRTPMNGILGFAELLLTPGLPHTDMVSFVEIINTCSAQLMALINDIIDISKIEAGQIRINKGKVSLKKLMAEVYSIASSNQLGKVELIAPDLSDAEDIIVVGDDIRLRQILLNLINNALKFTKQGKVEYGYFSESGLVTFYVRDTGIGIAAENHELIFKRFRQVNSSASREQGGTGLGLAISKALVEKMGGTITVESALGQGATFRIEIPFREMEAGAVEAITISNHTEISYNWSGKVVLIAEDEDANFTLLRMLLKSTACKIYRALSGREAVEMALKYKPNLILMDIKLPEISGFEATRLIKASLPDVPVIAQTAYALSDDRSKAIAAGCDHYISKPISKKVLLNAMSRYLLD